MPFAPSDLGTGLRIWLRAKDNGANGSSVSTWTDQSGRGNNATAASTAPTVETASTPGGGKSVVFAGTVVNFAASPELTQLISSAAVSSIPAGGSFGAAQTFDRDTAGNSRWLGSDPSVGTPQWARWTLTGATVVTSYTLWGHPTATQYNPSDWKLQGTNDGTFATWTDLDTRSGITWTTGIPKRFTFSNSTAYLYYRILITANVSATDFVAIQEVQFNSPEVAELWVMVKANSATGSTNSWQFGNSGQTTIYPWNTGQVIENFGVSTHSGLWTPSLSVNSWRLYRVRLTFDGAMTIWLDNTQQVSVSSLLWRWSQTPKLSQDFQGRIAELLVYQGAPLTDVQAANMIGYFNTEHGTSVPGSTQANLDAASLSVIAPGSPDARLDSAYLTALSQSSSRDARLDSAYISVLSQSQLVLTNPGYWGIPIN